MIVKVQIPLFTTDPQPSALIYDKAKRHYILQPLDDVLALMGGDIKAFFEATWNGQQWQLGKRVGDQGW